MAVAWPYASGPRHIGHVAGFGVPSDVFARYWRLRGASVLMVSGTDEHGTPILVAADREGVGPKEIADRYNAITAEDLRRLGVSYDLFTRTTTRNHAEVVQDVFRTLFEKGYLLRRTQQGAFSQETGRALPDRYIEGTCPHCGFDGARGDQCDNCGEMLDPLDLIEPRSRIDGKPPVFHESEHLLLDLPAFKRALQDWIESQDSWRHNVRNFSLHVLEELRPRAVTRDIDWGVPIPLPEFENREDKRIYVWFEAVIGYLSASIEWAEAREEPESWRAFWQNPEARHFYFMGKDNITFHSVMWPSILMGYGSGGEFGGGPPNLPLTLPEQIVSTEYLTMEGRKFSSSRGVVIEVRDFLSRYDPDPLRYYLTAAGPETQDTDFTWAEFVRRNNDELVATWGNLAHRALTVTRRHFPAVPAAGELEDGDRSLLDRVERGFATVGEQIGQAHFKAALSEAMALAIAVNQYLGEQEPWRLMESDRDRAATVLNVTLRCLDNLKVLLLPFLPFSSQRLHRMLGYPGEIAPMPERQRQEGDDPHLVLTGDYRLGEVRWAPTELPAGQVLGQPEPLFRKLDQEVVEQELARMERAPGPG